MASSNGRSTEVVIGHEPFRRLRLSQFLPAKKITPLADWEYQGRLWVGEAHGFSEWLRLQKDPENLGSLAIDFGTFPVGAAKRVLATLGLRLHKGMTATEIAAVLGRPRTTERFVPDRRTFEFVTGGKEPFRVSCTVLENGGLTYLGVMIPRSKKAQDR